MAPCPSSPLIICFFDASWGPIFWPFLGDLSQRRDPTIKAVSGTVGNQRRSWTILKVSFGSCERGGPFPLRGHWFPKTGLIVNCLIFGSIGPGALNCHGHSGCL